MGMQQKRNSNRKYSVKFFNSAGFKETSVAVFLLFVCLIINMPRLYLGKFCFVSLINQHRSEKSMVSIIIYLHVVSNFDAVQKPKIGIAIPYSFIRQWVKFCYSYYIKTKKDSILSKTVNIFKHFVRNKF